jgi:hypothetical protein
MILDRIIGRLRDLVQHVRASIDETREKLQERRAESLREKLNEMAKDTPYSNWAISVADLANLVGEDGSFEGRKQLWADLRCEGKYTGSAEQNIALHAKLLEELPRHGIPWPKVAS